MEKQKRWQLVIILTVLAWTFYNILPTVIYYARPLHEQVDANGAKAIEESIAGRISGLEEDAVDWLYSFGKMIGVSPKNIRVSPEDPALISFDVATDEDVKTVQRFLPRAGMMISFRPAQLFLVGTQGHTINVVRRVGLSIKDPSRFFQFFHKRGEDGLPSQEYFSAARDRFIDVAYVCGGPSEISQQVVLANAQPVDRELLDHLVSEFSEWKQILDSKSALTSRLLKSAFSSPLQGGRNSFDLFIEQLQQEIESLKKEISESSKNQKEILEKNGVVSAKALDLQKQLTSRLEKYQEVLAWLSSQKKLILSSGAAWSKEKLVQWMNEQHKNPKKERFQIVLDDRHPFISSLSLDMLQDQIEIVLHEDVAAIMQIKAAETEKEARLQDTLSRMVMNEMAHVSKATNEDFKGEGGIYQSRLSQSSSSNGLIALSCNEVATDLLSSILDQIRLQWQPRSADLQEDAYPRVSAKGYESESAASKKLCLLVFSPSVNDLFPDQLKKSSLYVVLRGGQKLFSHNEGSDGSLRKDIEELSQLLGQRGFVGYPGNVFGKDSEFSADIVFELENFCEPIIEATREAFYLPGRLPFAFLECGNWESRILAENRIDDALQEELIKWKEAWQAAQVSLNPVERYTIPRPTKNVMWSNFKRSCSKYWRGDDSRIIRWGLDLSGGKSVRVCLLDQSNRPVTKAEDLKQATSELYSRLNKMGVSERTIRMENGTILIDFPGVHDVTASELVKASAMYFHVVNEKFGPLHAELARPAQAFLQEVWNEAVVTNCKDSESLNKIAWRKIQAVKSGLVNDENIKTLLDSGLVMSDPSAPPATAGFDDRVSMIARWQGDDPAEWHTNGGHPLVIVFRNFALEGCNLENVHPSYDPSKGNILVFGVRSSDARGQGMYPRDEFYTWTSQFSEEGIAGTVKEQYSRGHGWRMAVVLNGVVVSSPQLSSALKDSAMISGNFSQREVQHLATNLQAGSLSFTPKVLSEQNVSPELGIKERYQGLAAAALSVLAVVGIMVAYYRFGGVVASLAVLFNLLIIWAVMQNIEAALTLPAIAGIVLTVAMAVDANVLVFERIREEFAISGRIASAIARGYQKAFSAIVDSNLTTLIAAFILTQFDSGPVRGFAMVLIIGLTSSMFTSLFVTRYYFTVWAENPKHVKLSMANWIRSTNFDFLAWKRIAIVASVIVLVIGSAVMAFTWRSMLGMDFTGGYALVVEATTAEGTPRDLAEKALTSKGVLPSEIQIRELGRPTALRLQLSSSLEEPGRPFHGLPEGISETSTAFDYQKVPRVDWVVTTLEQGGLQIQEADKTVLLQQWTAISGQFSDVMRNNAVMALLLAVVAILIYIAIRFEWKYAISAVLALFHDVLLTLATLAILRLFGLPFQINLEVIGAFMTIIGYSLNDTIIVFDRVREDYGLYRKKNFSEIVNMALNSTLSRTVMTSGITLVVLLCLVCFGGPSIFGFSFVMFLGVFLGTLSSLFIAGPLLVFFAKEEKTDE
jgi:SecD/SecF fusion protein